MFQRATKKKQKARIGLIGPAGSGKTYTSLTLAKELAGPSGKVAVIDTERGSASKYSGDVADFDVCEPRDFSPSAYLDAIKEAASAGYDVLIVDSLSHAWEGEGGILDQVDKRGGRFDAWKDMSPQTRKLIDAILTYPGHVVATMRTKTEWVVEEIEDRGKTKKVPRKLGLAPRFKEGLEYELDIVGTFDDDNVLRVTKSRCPGLTGETISKPGRDLAMRIRAWLEDGVDEEGRIAALLEMAEGPLDLEQAGTELARARRSKLINDEAHGRLVAIGRAARERVSGATKVAEGSVS